ncbi:MAG: hypothetical protein QUU85_00975, partial [Candidatus Eisenbacteria bacterium]|nr:hypothetical protein [Candidatus Eisenbacteria bacterium]
MNRNPTRAAIEAAIAAYPRIDRPALPGRKNDIDSGILVPLVGEGELSCVLTERPRTLRRHAARSVSRVAAPKKV